MLLLAEPQTSNPKPQTVFGVANVAHLCLKNEVFFVNS